jgi:ABC-type multidrug transport system ATPase subunit
MNVVVAQELRKRYGETVAVDGVSLVVERGEVR